MFHLSLWVFHLQTILIIIKLIIYTIYCNGLFNYWKVREINSQHLSKNWKSRIPVLVNVSSFFNNIPLNEIIMFAFDYILLNNNCIIITRKILKNFIFCCIWDTFIFLDMFMKKLTLWPCILLQLTAQKMSFSIKDFFSKCDQISR